MLRPDRAALGTLVLLGTLAACAEWPRYQHPPGHGDGVKAGTDPRELFQLTWTKADEIESNDLPADAQQASLPMDTGALRVGELSGLGWNDNAVPQPIEDEACGSSGVRTALPEGDYVADVDFYVFHLESPGRLCARVLTDAPDVGWDLLLFSLDDCLVPGPAVTDAQGAVLGLDLGGAEGEWTIPVEEGTVALMIAGYHPTDLDARVAYDLGVSLVADDGSTLCPLLPTEVE